MTNPCRCIRKIFALSILFLVVGAGGSLIALSDNESALEPRDNSRCLKCHQELTSEPLVMLHTQAALTCMACHGESVEHIADEHHAVPPDFLFGRKEVNAQCESCHETHPDEHAVNEIRKQWDGVRRPNGRLVSAESLCTDCHGTHTIAPGSCSDCHDWPGKKWKRLFNGVNLEGWTASGEANWTVEDETLVGKQGEGNKPGDLFTTCDYRDFILRAAFRIVWPANSGVWFRYQSDSVAYQADILEYKDPLCWSGSLYCTGKMFLAMNTDASLVNREGWNTLEVRAKGDHLRVLINGQKVADVHDNTSDHGKIGFQIHQGDEFKSMRLYVRDVLLLPLGEETDR
ncbi:MAG: family 16 glycoside hydrolase [bacterium]